MLFVLSLMQSYTAVIEIKVKIFRCAGEFGTLEREYILTALSPSKGSSRQSRRGGREHLTSVCMVGRRVAYARNDLLMILRGLILGATTLEMDNGITRVISLQGLRLKRISC